MGGRGKRRGSRASKALRRRNGGELTELETEIMQVVWSRRTATAAEIREALKPTRPLALTTIITVLDRLNKKGVIHAVPTVERARRWSASVPKEAVANNLLSSLVKRFFNDSPASLVAHLMRHESVDEDELETIRNLFTDSSQGGKDE